MWLLVHDGGIAQKQSTSDLNFLPYIGFLLQTHADKEN